MVSQRKAIFSDVHGNYPALTRVLYEIMHNRQIPCEDIICLGDLVGYYPWPNECVSLVRRLQIPTVLIGNHDEAVVDPNFDIEKYMEKGWGRHSLRPIEHQREELTPENASFLRSLDYMVHEQDYELAHACSLEPENFWYVDKEKKPHGVLPTDAFAAMKTLLAFVGHTHNPGMFEEVLSQTDISKFKHSYFPDTPLQLKKGVKHIVNVGSVGYPRSDDDNRACFVVYERKEDEKEGIIHSVEFVRVEYPFEETQRKVIEANYGTVDVQGHVIDVSQHLADKLARRV